MSLEDIERLKEKVNKDPHSKLFIPLAEEYKKAGMFDEAIDVLNKGLEAQPGYMSARVSLGKIYLDRGMLEEARAEFEKVINAIPDNLYAHKKLAEIYRDLNERDKAVKEFKIVLKLNPMDEWAATNLSDIEEGIKPQPEVTEKVTAEESILSEPKAITEAEEEKPPEIPIGEEVREGVDETFSEILEEEAETETPEVAEEISEEEPLSFESILKEEVAVQEKDKTIKEDKVYEHPHLSMDDADPYITEGKYTEAMNIYRKLLSTEPDNMHVMQRIEELKALLKLLGKDKEELIARLDNLLEDIKKRRDEFLGSA
jgi:tetratricopeptide (TPR) repeat protein